MLTSFVAANCKNGRCSEEDDAASKHTVEGYLLGGDASLCAAYRYLFVQLFQTDAFHKGSVDGACEVADDVVDRMARH